MKRQEHDDRIRIEIPGGKGKAGPSPDRSQGYILRQQEQEQKSRPDHQADPPVDHPDDGAAGEDALAALEVEHAGEHVAQQTEQGSPVLSEQAPHIDR